MVRRLKKTGSGFTLIELLVVIAIIGMLAALLLPAVNAAREAGRRVTCTNQAKQLALANASFETSRSRYPGMAEDLTNPSGTTAAPWLVMLMPFLERQDIYDDYTSNAAPTTNNIYLKLLRCPSNPPSSVSTAQNSYIGNGGYISNDKVENGVLTDRLAANQPFFPAPRNTVRMPAPSVKSDNIYDGLSNVLLISENLLAGEWSKATPLQASPMKLESVFVWHDAESSKRKINGERVLQTTIDIDLLRPSSQHPGGVVAAFLDGHTHFLKENIQYHVYQQLMTTNHKKSSVPSANLSYVLQDADYE